MVLIGAGQGLAFAPMTSAGIAGVGAGDAGAASGMVNTFHQVGMALGLAHVDMALTAGSVLLVLCLVTVLALILPAELAGRQHDTGGPACQSRPSGCWPR
jgi:hypothetical protein